MQMSEKSKEVSDYEESVKHIANIGTNIEKLKAKHDNARREIERLQTNIRELEWELTEKEKKLADIKRLRETISELKNRLERNTTATQNTVRNSEKQKTEIANLKGNAREQKAEIAKLEGNASKQRDKIEELKNKEKIYITKIKKSDQEIQDLTKKERDLKEKLGQKQNEVKRYQDLVTKNRKKISALGTSKAEEAAEMQKINEILKLEVIKYKKKLEEISTENVNHKAELNTLEETNKKLRDQLDAKIKETEDNSKVLKQLEDRDVQISVLRKKLEKLDNDLKQNIDKVNTVERRFLRQFATEKKDLLKKLEARGEVTPDAVATRKILKKDIRDLETRIGDDLKLNEQQFVTKYERLSMKKNEYKENTDGRNRIEKSLAKLRRDYPTELEKFQNKKKREIYSLMKEKDPESKRTLKLMTSLYPNLAKQAKNALKIMKPRVRNGKKSRENDVMNEFKRMYDETRKSEGLHVQLRF